MPRQCAHACTTARERTWGGGGGESEEWARKRGGSEDGTCVSASRERRSGERMEKPSWELGEKKKKKERRRRRLVPPRQRRCRRTAKTALSSALRVSSGYITLSPMREFPADVPPFFSLPTSPSDPSSLRGTGHLRARTSSKPAYLAKWRPPGG